MIKCVKINIPDRGEITDSLMLKTDFIFLPLTLQICFSSNRWPNKYAIGLIRALKGFIQLFQFAIVSRLRDQELCGEYTVDTMNEAEKRRQEIHVSSINLFILSFSKQDMNNSLFYFQRMSQRAPSYSYTS